MSQQRRAITAGTVGLAASLLLAAPVVSEVRLVPATGASAPSLQVVATARGPWSRISASPRAALNPAGDLLGDGWPSHRVAANRVLAAWFRPLDSTLQLASGDVDWHWQAGVVAHRAAGTPLIATSPGSPGWVIAWQEGPSGDGATPTLRLVATSPDGDVSPTVSLGPGHLIDLISIAGEPTRPSSRSSKHAFSPEPATNVPAASESVHVLVYVPRPIPDDIFGRLQLHVLVGAGDDSTDPSGTPTLTTAADGPVDLAAWPAMDAPEGVEDQWLPLQPLVDADVRVHELGGRHGESLLVVTWWADPWLVQWVELAADGPRLPVASVHARGHAPWSPGLVQQALQQARQR